MSMREPSASVSRMRRLGPSGRLLLGAMASSAPSGELLLVGSAPAGLSWATESDEHRAPAVTAAACFRNSRRSIVCSSRALIACALALPRAPITSRPAWPCNGRRELLKKLQPAQRDPVGD